MAEATPVMVVAIHEAGHMTAAIALGTPIRRASLKGVVTLVRNGCPKAQRNEAIIALAGAEAETKHCHYSADRQVELWGDADAWATDWSNALRHLEGADIVPALLQARQLVHRHWGLVEVLAQALHDRGELSGAQIAALAKSEGSLY